MANVYSIPGADSNLTGLFLALANVEQAAKTAANQLRGCAVSDLETVIESAFGSCAEDVVTPIKCGAEAFHWLEELFKTIISEAEKGGPVSHFRIKSLAGAGAYLAFDYGNYTGSQYEEMERKLRSAGISVGVEK